MIRRIVRYDPTILVPLPTATTHIVTVDIVTRAFWFDCYSKELFRLVLVPLLLALLALVPSVVLADSLGRSPTPSPGGRGVRPEAGGPILAWDSRPSSYRIYRTK